MEAQHKSETAQANVIRFARRKPVAIDPDLKNFLDEVVIPLLIRDAMKGINEKRLAADTANGANSAQMCERGTFAGELKP